MIFVVITMGADICKLFVVTCTRFQMPNCISYWLWKARHLSLMTDRIGVSVTWISNRNRGWVSISAFCCESQTSWFWSAECNLLYVVRFYFAYCRSFETLRWPEWFSYTGRGNARSWPVEMMVFFPRPAESGWRMICDRVNGMSKPSRSVLAANWIVDSCACVSWIRFTVQGRTGLCDQQRKNARTL